MSEQKMEQKIKAIETVEKEIDALKSVLLLDAQSHSKAGIKTVVSNIYDRCKDLKREVKLSEPAKNWEQLLYDVGFVKKIAKDIFSEMETGEYFCISKFVYIDQDETFAVWFEENELGLHKVDINFCALEKDDPVIVYPKELEAIYKAMELHIEEENDE